MTAAQSGDAAAVSALFRAAWPAAYRVARSMLRDSAAAEDAAQDACARAMPALASLRRPERFAPWFYRIVVNEAKQRLRAAAREAAYAEAAEFPRTALEHAETVHDDRLDVRRAIERLEPSLRVAIVLRYYVGLSSAEIGTALAVSPVTARWRLMIAHRKLRALLAPVAGTEFAVAEELCP